MNERGQFFGGVISERERLCANNSGVCSCPHVIEDDHKKMIGQSHTSDHTHTSDLTHTRSSSHLYTHSHTHTSDLTHISLHQETIDYPKLKSGMNETYDNKQDKIEVVMRGDACCGCDDPLWDQWTPTVYRFPHGMSLNRGCFWGM